MTSEIKDQSIDYIEVGVCEGSKETIGLLSSFNQLQDSLYIIPKIEGQCAYLNLKYFSLTFIKVGYEEKYEEFFFKNNEKDQNEAKNILSSLIIKLRADNRCSNSDFVRTDSYLRIPQDYVNSRVYKSTVNNTTNSTKSTFYGYPQGVAKVVGHVTQNKPKITFISRKTQLPKKTKLKALEARIVQGNIQVELPISEDLEEVIDTVDDDYANMYGAY